MIAPQHRPVARGAKEDGLAARRLRIPRPRQRFLSTGSPRPFPWQLFLDDRRAIRFKWGLLALFLLAAALFDLPL